MDAHDGARPSLAVAFERGEHRAAQRRIEVVSDRHPTTPATRCAVFVHCAEWNEASYWHARLRDHDLFARRRPIDKLREMRLCFVDVHGFGHSLAPAGDEWE